MADDLSLTGIEAGVEGVAIVGMSVRLPGAADLGTFWSNLRGGVESIRFFTDGELLAAGVSPLQVQDPGYVKARGALDGIDLFDAAFFGFTPREAETMDPQHRLFLEAAWTALEHAGCSTETYEGAIGVFAGANLTGYLLRNLAPNEDLVRRVGPLQIRIRNDKDFLATLVAYKLDLKGPAINVQTACSSSLVGVALACQSLLSYQCDMALAGGVSVTVPAHSGYLFQEGVYAPDGHCRAFDAQARGTVLGDGTAVVVLKRLRDALDEGDTIHAVIRGFATNNDGALKLDYTAPSVDGQAEVIGMAQSLGEIDPGTVTYVEAHGTGTPLGDPIEITALTQTFRAGTGARGFCALGSVKTNIGHLDAAAGTAGLVKTVLALRHREIPPTLHFTRPNPQLDLESSPFYVASELRPWRVPTGVPRRAGVSSFGVGGTNAHVVVEEAPAAPLPEPSRPWHPLVLSARSAEALDQAACNLADHLESHPDLDLADVCHTLHRGRRAFAHRRMVVCGSREEAIRLLRGAEPRRVLSARMDEGERPAVAFLFSGIGDQSAGMARGLYEGEPVFREQVDLACRLLEPYLGLDLRKLLFPAGGGLSVERGRPDLRSLLGASDLAESPLDRTALLHPAIFVIEHALARLWMSWGIRPQALIGYSIGEYVAACLAGVFSLEEGLELVAARARIIDGLPRGAMLAVSLPEGDLAPLLGEWLSLAAVNGPAFCVAAGPVEEIESLERRLGVSGVVCRRLRTGHAFHSRMMEPALDTFVRAASRVRLSTPAIPIVSNVSGTWLEDGQATDPRYWAEHLCRTVRFGEGVEALCREGRWALVEVGPGNSLASIALQSDAAPLAALPSLPNVHDGEPDRAVLASALGRLWLSGVEPDWQAYWSGERRTRVPLPTYPFERKSFWIDPPRPGGAAATAVESDPLARKTDPSDWFYVPVWKESRLVAPDRRESEPGRPWLVFLDGEGLGLRLADRLRERGFRVATAEPGELCAEVAPGRFTLDPGVPGHYEKLLGKLQDRGELPGTVLHLWSYGPVAGEIPGPEDAGEAQEAGFFSLLFLAQAWGSRAGREELRLIAVSSGVHEVTGEEDLDPLRSTIAGPCRVIPQEYPAIACLHLDLPVPSPGGPVALWVDRVVDEALRDLNEPVVALRGRSRWVEEVQPFPLSLAEPSSRLRDRGIYLITGGLGGIGLTLARTLVERVRARLVLVGRTPPREEALAVLRELESLGGEVLVLAADVTRREAMAEVRRAAIERFGAVHGVIHAAGTPPGGLIQLKDRETASAVLAPKVQGTLVLHQVFAGDALDFLLLCSSLTSLLGAFGLVDHCAANAFLDVFARRAGRAGSPVLSVGWDSWLEVGQAARAGVSSRLQTLLEAPGERLHPLLDWRAEGEDGRQVFVTRFTARDHWVVREHRIHGQGVVPATAFLEMARAAHAQVAGGRDVVLSEFVFAHPLVVPDGGAQTVRTLLQPMEDGRYELRIVSDGLGGAVQQHVHGWIGPVDTASAGPVSGPELPQGEERSAVLMASLASAGVELGPRWSGLLRELRCGEREGWARFELPEELRPDLDGFGLHPALLDAATGVVRILGEGVRLPFAFRRMRVFGPLPAMLSSRFRLCPEAGGEGELTCDITIFDERDGRPLVEIDGYTLRRLADSAVLRPTGASPLPSANEDGFGISPAEGAEAFARLLSRGLGEPRILVSTRDLPALRERFRRRLTREEFDAHLSRLQTAGAAHPRPSLQTPYEAPRSPLEKQLVRLYQEMLGIDRVGIHDNFFDLGGNSLVATQLLSRLRDELDVEMALRTVFEAPSVAELGRAVVVRQAELSGQDELAQALAELQQMSREELRAHLGEVP